MRVKLLLVILLSFSFNACVKKVPVNQPTGFLANSNEIALISAAISNRQNKLSTMKALYYTIIEHGKTKERLRQVFLYEKPGKLRVEILPTTSSYTLGLLIASGSKAQFVESDTGKVTNSDSVEDLIYDTLRFQAGVSEVINALAGFIPESAGTAGSGQGDVEFYVSGNEQYQVFIKNSGYNAQLSGPDYLISKAQFIDKENNRVLMEVEYSDYKTYNSLSLPSSLKIYLVRDGVTVNLKVSHMRVNDAVPPKMFEFLEGNETH